MLGAAICIPWRIELTVLAAEWSDVWPGLGQLGLASLRWPGEWTAGTRVYWHTKEALKRGLNFRAGEPWIGSPQDRWWLLCGQLASCWRTVITHTPRVPRGSVFDYFEGFEERRAGDCLLRSLRANWDKIPNPIPILNSHTPHTTPMSGPNKWRSWRHRTLHRQLICSVAVDVNVAVDDGVSGESSYRQGEPPPKALGLCKGPLLARNPVHCTYVCILACACREEKHVFIARWLLFVSFSQMLLLNFICFLLCFTFINADASQMFSAFNSASTPFEVIESKHGWAVFLAFDWQTIVNHSWGFSWEAHKLIVYVFKNIIIQIFIIINMQI